MHFCVEANKTDEQNTSTAMTRARLCYNLGIEVQESGIENQYALESGERYHEPVHRILRKVKDEQPNIYTYLAPRVPMKEINDTMGPEGLVPSLLLFRSRRRIPATKANIVQQKNA